MWIRPAGGATTSRCTCGAATATAARSVYEQLGEPVGAAGGGHHRGGGGGGGRDVGAANRRRWRSSVATARPRRSGAASWRAGCGLPALLGEPCRSRDLAYALIVSRVLAPGSKLSTLAGWADTTLGTDLGVAGASTDEIYAAMDWLYAGQDDIEKQLAARHLGRKANPSRSAMFDLSSSWVTGRHCALAARGYSRDAKKGCEQIEYGLLTDLAGRPVAVRVFPGNTADPTAFTAAVTAVKDTFALANMVMVGDRGMITSARIAALRDSGGIGWLTALRARPSPNSPPIPGRCR